MQHFHPFSNVTYFGYKYLTSIEFICNLSFFTQTPMAEERLLLTMYTKMNTAMLMLVATCIFTFSTVKITNMYSQVRIFSIVLLY